MKSTFFTLTVLFIISSVQFSVAQDTEDPILMAKMQFSSLFMGTNNSFRELKGKLYSDDENWSYYTSEYGLGDKAVTILQNKKDTAAWYCYIQYSLDTDLTELPTIQSGVFGMLNMLITAGKIRGTENTEENITRTDLYVKSNDAWMGELVTDGNKKTFTIFLKNTPWP